MEEIKITWQLLGVCGAFCGVIVGIVKWVANDIRDSVKKLVDTTNSHTTEITVERYRNNNQDERLDGHDEEISTLRERVFQVTYRKTP